jgi:hypothetical protein
LRSRKKRRPPCSEADTGFDVTRHESEPTSDRSIFAREFGEPTARGKANGDNGEAVDRCAPGFGEGMGVP